MAPRQEESNDNLCPHCKYENENGFKNGPDRGKKRKKNDIRTIKSRTELGQRAEHKLHSDIGPKTALGEWMVNYIIPQFENNVMAFVYFGAALLVVIVGLRGVGSAIENVAFIPDFLIQETEGMKHLSSNLVIIALIFEFLLIATMAAVMFFKPEQPVGEIDTKSGSTGSVVIDLTIVDSLQTVKDFFSNEIKSPLTDVIKKKQVEEFLPIIDYYIKEESPNEEFDDSSFLGE